MITHDQAKAAISILDEYLFQCKTVLKANQPKKGINLSDSIDVLDVNSRVWWCLNANKIRTFEDLMGVGNECMKWKNFSNKSYRHLCESLDDIGVKWPIKDKRLFPGWFPDYGI